MTDLSTKPDRGIRLDLIALTAILFVGLGLVSFSYIFAFDFECRAQLPAAFCQAMSFGPPRALCVTALFLIMLKVPGGVGPVLSPLWRAHYASSGLGALIAGFCLILAPVAWFAFVGAHMALQAQMICWFAGLFVGTAGLVHTVFDTTRITREVLRRAGAPILACIVIGLLLPELTLSFQPFWYVQGIADITFYGVQNILELLGQNISTDVAFKAIWIDDFGVAVGWQCSGVEGFAIISFFTIAYLTLFRKQLILRRAWLILPVALLASWALNIVRIAVLLLMGRYISPDLAVNGFHSHAGWLAFLVLSLLVALAAHNIPWLQKHPNETALSVDRPDFFDDPAVAMILPFAVFMASSTFVSAISETPSLLYPLRAALVAGVLALSWTALRALEWRFDLLSLGTGVACGVLWVLTAPAAGDMDTLLTSALAELGPTLFAGWVAVRLLGTTLLVPLVEELFFRGYLQRRLALGDGQIWAITGLLVSAALFAALHDRWLAAGLAGVLFGLLQMRRNRVTDAIQGHAAANGVIALAALWQGAWHLI